MGEADDNEREHDPVAPQPPVAPLQPPPMSPAAATGVNDELSRLAAQHEAGQLTDDEFAAQMARVLEG